MWASPIEHHGLSGGVLFNNRYFIDITHIGGICLAIYWISGQIIGIKNMRMGNKEDVLQEAYSTAVVGWISSTKCY